MISLKLTNIRFQVYCNSNLPGKVLVVLGILHLSSAFASFILKEYLMVAVANWKNNRNVPTA